MTGVNLKELIGKEIVAKETVTKEIMGRAIKKQKWTIVEAYPYHVRAMRITEDGREVYNSFSIGDLILMGIINTAQPRYGNSYRLYKGGDYDG